MSRALRVALHTQGCKVNLFDQWQAEEGLAAQGRPVDLVPWDDPADVYVLNTCTVTAQADRQNRQLVYRVARREPGAAVVVTGCQAQIDPEAVAALPGVVRVVPNTAKADLPAIVASLPLRDELSALAGGLGSSTPRTRPILKIQDGCDTGCSYCILPAARGASRSVSADEVLARLHALGEAGTAEVVLTGLNMGDWGLDLRPRASLAALLARIEDEAPVPRLRLSSVEPRGVTDELIEVLATARVTCHHLHVPLQAGSDRVLKAMRRPYRRGWFEALCGRLLRALPGVTLGTDVICGFPGEDEAAFEETARVCEEVPLAYLHAFPYSPRTGTLAVGLGDPVLPADKKRRVKRLRALSEVRREALARSVVGEDVEVVVEPGARAGAGVLRGLTRGYVPVAFDGPDSLVGRLATVRAESAEGPGASGRLVEAPTDA